MRLAFMGTPDFAVVALDALVAAGHDVAAVYTQPPRPGNRGRLAPSPVQERAEALALPVRTPASLKSTEEQRAFAALALDVAVVAAYGLLLPPAILAAPRLGCLNIHASLLPRWRGAAPVQRAILAGDDETGVTIMAMDKGLDTGPMLARGTTPVGAKSAGALTAELAQLGARLLLGTLAKPMWAATPQPERGATYAHKIRKEEARIDWRQPAAQLERLVRAMQPAPGAFFEHAGERVKLLQASLASEESAAAPGAWLGGGRVATGSGVLILNRVQPAGRQPMAAGDWANGRRLTSGTLL